MKRVTPEPSPRIVRPILLGVVLVGALGARGCPPPPQGDMVTVPAGGFVMGSPPSEIGHDADEVKHAVTLTRDFELGATEVTQASFRSLMGYDPSYHPKSGLGGDDLPVEQVSWFDALAFANRASESAGLPACYRLEDILCADESTGDDSSYCAEGGGIASATVSLEAAADPYSCAGYRLPTEAEWERAARAGSSTALPTGDVTQPGCSPLDPAVDAIAWYCGNVELKKTQPVGTKAANAYGLHDMAGNVSEWTGDIYQRDLSGAAVDPSGAASGHFRAVRGGAAWYHGGARVRSAARSAFAPGFRDRHLGFRLARTLGAGTAVTPAPTVGDAVEAEADLPRVPAALAVDLVRPDEGVPLTTAEIEEFTRRLTGFWKDTGYFDWVSRTSHGMDASNPAGWPDYKLYWQDTRALKSGDRVTFQHYGGADNLALRTAKLLNAAGAGYLMSGDPRLGEIAEQYAKGFIALFTGMDWTAEDPESFLMARAVFNRDHDYVQDGRDVSVDYGPVKVLKFDWNAHTIPNDLNPHYGPIWIRNMRSKDDVPHLFRSMPMLAMLAVNGADASVRAAAAEALERMRGFARDMVDTGYYIRTKDMDGNAYVPLKDGTDLVNDLASYVEYTFIVDDAECTGRLLPALVAYENPLDVDCETGFGSPYELVATYGHYFNYAIIRFHHAAALVNALMLGREDVAQPLLEGMASRADRIMARTMPNSDDPAYQSDAAAFLVVAAASGLPLTSREARYVVDWHTLSVDHYSPWPNWDLWDPGVPDGQPPFQPSRDRADDHAVRIPEMAFVLEYCQSPFRDPDGAPFVDCDVVADPSRWGE